MLAEHARSPAQPAQHDEISRRHRSVQELQVRHRADSHHGHRLRDHDARHAPLRAPARLARDGPQLLQSHGHHRRPDRVLDGAGTHARLPQTLHAVAHERAQHAGRVGTGAEIKRHRRDVRSNSFHPGPATSAWPSRSSSRRRPSWRTSRSAHRGTPPRSPSRGGSRGSVWTNFFSTVRRRRAACLHGPISFDLAARH